MRFQGGHCCWLAVGQMSKRSVAVSRSRYSLTNSWMRLAAAAGHSGDDGSTPPQPGKHREPAVRVFRLSSIYPVIPAGAGIRELGTPGARASGGD